MAIDWNFLGEVEGSAINRAYIPMKDGKPIQSSGVTVGTGVDLGAQSEDGLSKLGVSKSLINKLKPYLGKKKDAAVQAMQNSGELVLEDSEVKELDMAIKKDHLKFVRNWFNKNNTKGMDWSDLTDQQQTVVLSVEYNHGPAALKKYNFGKQVANNEWDKVADNLRNFYGSSSNELHSRRIKELQYLIGASVDGNAGPETEEKLNLFKSQVNQQDVPSFMGNASVVSHHRPSPVRESSVSLPDGFPEQFMAMMGEVVKASQSRSQEVSEPSTEPDVLKGREAAPFDPELDAFIQGVAEVNVQDKPALNPELDAFIDRAVRAMGTEETEEPVYAEEPQGGQDDSKDPIYGLF